MSTGLGVAASVRLGGRFPTAAGVDSPGIGPLATFGQLMDVTRQSSGSGHGMVITRIAHLLRRAPVSVVALAVLWIVGSTTHSLVAGPAPGLLDVIGVGVEPLRVGHWWTPVTSELWCAGTVSYLATSLLLLGLLAPAENRIGSTRTAFLLVVTQVLGTAVGVALVIGGVRAGDPWSVQLASRTAVGPSPAIVGVSLAASVRLGALWRRRVRVVLSVALAMLALYSGSLQDVFRLVGGLVGLLLGPFVLGRPDRQHTLAVSTTESRTLVALVVAASAVGPLLAAVSGTAIGPLSVLRLLVLDSPPDLAAVQATCADPASAEDCLTLRYRLRLNGAGPAIMSILPALLLLVLADGLRRGRAIAWWGAVGLNTFFALAGGLLPILSATSPAERLVAFGGASDAQFRAGVLADVAQPLAVIALLVLTRTRYRIPAPPGAYRRWATILAATLAATSTIFLIGAYLDRADFMPIPGWAELLADLPTRFLPPGYLGEVEISFLPVTPLATVLYAWTGVGFWAVGIGTTLWLLRRTQILTGDLRLARDLITDYGGSTLSWLSTWAGNNYWFHTKAGPIHTAGPTRPCAGVAYRVIAGVALTTGEPFGELASRAAALEGFTRYCTERAWTPCLYSVGESIRLHAEAMGWRSVQVAEETVLPLEDLAFTGKKWQDIRTALNNATRATITAEWITYTGAPLAITEQIRAISEEWIADKGLPEMGFTLGGLDELADDEVRCLIAVGIDRTVHGITSWLPIYDEGKITGWTLDFMRRRATGFRGVMEFLIASAALRFKEEGAHVLSLSGAPLARLDRGQQPDALQNLLDVFGRALEPIYGFRSLLAFKAKFQPEYRPLYMAYPDSAALPAIATAIGRAYLPRLGAGHALLLLRQLRR